MVAMDTPKASIPTTLGCFQKLFLFCKPFSTSDLKHLTNQTSDRNQQQLLAHSLCHVFFFNKGEKKTALQCFLVGKRGLQVGVRISASESCRNDFRKMSLAGFLHQQPLGPPSASSLRAGIWAKTSLSGSQRQDPALAPLARVTVGGSLVQAI